MGTNRRWQRSNLHRRLFGAQLIDTLRAGDAARFDRESGKCRGAVSQHLDELADAEPSGSFNPATGKLSADLARVRSIARRDCISRGRIGCQRVRIGATGRSAVGRDRASCRRLPRLISREAAKCDEYSRDYKSCVRRKQRLIFGLASTQRKEVIRCLMVQQGGRRGVFAGPRADERPHLRPLTMSKGTAA